MSSGHEKLQAGFSQIAAGPPQSVESELFCPELLSIDEVGKE
jgi:hypothetical protein